MSWVRIKPGTRYLMVASLLIWFVVFWLGYSPVENRLYDFQLLLRRGLEGERPLAPGLVLTALDRKAFRAGLRAEDLAQMGNRLEGRVVDVSRLELAPFFEADTDGVVRAVRLFVTSPSGEKMPCPLLLEVLARRGINPSEIEYRTDHIRFPGGVFPVDQQGRLYPFWPTANPYAAKYKVLQQEELLASIGLDVSDRIVAKNWLEPTSVVDLLQDPVDLSDSLILLGLFLNEADEIEFDTPTGHMVRLELAGSLVDSLMRGSYLKPLPVWQAVLIDWLFLIALSILLPGRRTLDSVGWWMGWTLTWIATNQMLFQQGLFLQQSGVLAAGCVVLATHLSQRSWWVNSLLQALGGHAPLEKTGDELVATILFTNLPDLIKDLEETEPEKALAARAAHSRCVGYLVERYGGRLVDLQGDAQMVAFGLEGETQHREQAVCCALAIVDQVNSLLGHSQDAPEVFCGLVTGEVATGRVGGGQYRGVAAIGDTTNSAARLMGQAKKLATPVLAAQTTVEGLGPRAVLLPVGEIKVKGREEALEAWQVLEFQLPPSQHRAPVRGQRVRHTALALGSAALASVLLALLVDFRLPFRTLLLDTLTPTQQAAPELLLAGLDEESLERQPWPWPRGLHARVAENCLRAGARCVFLDFLFEDASDPQQDEILVSTVKADPRLIVAAAALPDAHHQPTSPELLPGLLATGQWGLINHSPRNEGNRMRYALWSMALDQGTRRGPGVVHRMADLLGLPGKPEQDFLIRWGPRPDGISYHRLLDPEDEVFRSMSGKIVIAGDMLVGRSDVFETPVGPLKGAMIHALSLQTLLTRELITDLSGSSLVFFLALVVAGAFIYFSLLSDGLGAQLALLLAGSVATTIVVKLMTGLGYYLGPLLVLTVPMAILVARLLTVTDARRAVTSYIPRKLQEQLELGGSMADIETLGTVLLTDIRGYTTLSEGRAPSEILALLNRYHEKTAAIYERLGGHLLTYQGDAQIVVFGPLERVDNPVAQAVQAALLLPEVVREVALEAGLPEGVLRVGAGITTGVLSLGLLGATGQKQYSVFGAPVRRAHSLQSLSDELQAPVILDQRSYLAVKDVLTLHSHATPSGDVVYTLN